MRHFYQDMIKFGEKPDSKKKGQVENQFPKMTADGENLVLIVQTDKDTTVVCDMIRFFGNSSYFDPLLNKERFNTARLVNRVIVWDGGIQVPLDTLLTKKCVAIPENKFRSILGERPKRLGS